MIPLIRWNFTIIPDNQEKYVTLLSAGGYSVGSYTSFASVYDTFMDNVPYEEWGEYIHGMLCERGITAGIVLDLGCGTGSMTEILAGFGYDMIGVDNSEEMLEIAREKQIKSGHEILYLLQDMREFELYGTVGAVFSICDSLNYITEPEELKQVFRWVNNYLDPGGIFILILIQNISTGRFWVIRPLQRPERTVALSGTIIIMRKSGSMNTN